MRLSPFVFIIAIALLLLGTGVPLIAHGGGAPCGPPCHVTGITLNESNHTLAVSETDQLVPTIAPPGATDKTVSYASDASGVASVSSSGLVTAIAAGTATITVTANDTTNGTFTATDFITVNAPIAVTGVSLNESTHTLLVGGTDQLVPTIAPADATDKTVTYTSNHENIATVSSSGLVTAVAAGTATITVTTNGTFTATDFITVNNPLTLYWFNSGADAQWTTLTGNWWTDAGHTSPAGSLPASIDTVVALGTVGPNVNADIWTAPASIDAPSTAGITFISTNINWDYISINVTASTTFNGPIYSLGTLTGTTTFNGASYNKGIVNGTTTFNGSNWNEGIINGSVSFYGPSDNNIGATINGDVVFYGTSVSQNFGTINGDATFSGLGSNAGTVNGTAKFTYGTGGVLTIPTGGRWDYGNASAIVGVDDIPIASWIFTGTSYNAGNTITGNATFNDSSHNESGITGNPTFNGSSYNHITITGNPTFNGDLSENLGTVFGIKTRRYASNITTTRNFVTGGPWTVLADGARVNVSGATYDTTPGHSTYTTFSSANGGCFIGGPSPVCSITVTGVSLNEANHTLLVGGTDQLVPTIAPADATDKTVSYTSNHGNIATVSSSGLVTAVAAGTATITATAHDTTNGTFTATDAITVASDLTTLIADIATANAALVGVIEGAVPGNHIIGSSATLTAAITAAQVVTDAEAQSVVNAADATLNAAFATFNAAIVPASNVSALTVAKATAAGLIAANAAESTTPGQHVVGSLATLVSANVAANATSASAQSVVDGQVSTLNAAITAYNAAIVPASDISALTTEIATAQGVASAAVVGTALGQYSQTDLDTFNAAITAAQAVTNAKAQSVADAAVGTLVSAVSAFQGSVVTLNFSTTDVGGSHLANVTNATGASATSNGMTVAFNIPAGTTITGPLTWDGSLSPPVTTTNYTAPSTSGLTTSIVYSFEMGAGSTPLTFDKGVQIVFTGQAGKLVGWSQNGVFTPVTATCSANTQTAGDNLAAGGDCTITSGSDLIVWTKHFTVFIIYTQAAAYSPIGFGGQFSGGGSVSTLVSPVISLSSSASSSASTAFSIGDTGSTVLALQNYLIAKGYLKSRYATAYFGPITQAALAAYNADSSSNATPSVSSLTRDLSLGSKSSDVKTLQRYLNANGYLLASSGAGSPGNETAYFFGSLTRAALVIFQKDYGIPATGYFGPLTRAKMQEIEGKR